MYYFFKVNYWVSDDDLTEDKGFICGRNYQDAAHRLTEIYEEREIESMSLQIVSDLDVLLCNEDEIAKKLMEENNL